MGFPELADVEVVFLRVVVQQEEQEVAVGLRGGLEEAEGYVEACRTQEHFGKKEKWSIYDEIPPEADSNRSMTVGPHLPNINVKL